jgi:ParB family chromosome partitioning protein
MTEPARRPGAGGLGRGLAALIPQRPATTAGGEIPIDRIRHNPYQPRQAAVEADLERLTASIAEHGVLQPILVVETIDGYQLVAGERRLRAAELAGLTRIPAVIRQARPRDQLELALVENLQRTDLNPLDEARAYRQLVDEFGLTHDEVAAAVGKARPTIANTLRLLDLAARVQEALADGTLSEGHARALIGLPEEAQIELTAVVKARQLSVRDTERLARRLKDGTSGAAAPVRPARVADPELERLAADLRTALGTKVTLTPGRRGGRIVIEYYDGDDLERIYERLTGSLS